MISKFGLNYLLQVQEFENGPYVTVGLPFTIQFDITRNTLTSANVCQIRIYNLSSKNRNKIRFNQGNYGEFRQVTLQAGYGKNMPIVFTGNISQAWSVREGVDFITQIECYDGGFAFANGFTNIQFPIGIPFTGVIGALAGTLPNVVLGAIGSYPGFLSRGNTYNGNTTEILRDLTGGGFFIDNGKANALGTNEYILNGVPLLINAQSGLLGTPVLEQTIVRFDMLFEPSLNSGQSIALVSLTEPALSGLYKVTGVKHRGMISSAVCGEAITTGEFFYTKLLTPVVRV